jgi:broad specificity phosphatase PhoE
VTTLAVETPNGTNTESEGGTLHDALSRLFRLEDVTTTELLLVRHAEPDYKAGEASDSPNDPPLTAAGRNQAMRIAVRLRPLPVDALYASTMRRARETAAFIAAAKDMSVAAAHDLREIDFDRAAMGPIGVDLSNRALELARRFATQASWDELPGFEPASGFRRRVFQGIEAITARHPGQRVVIVAHGGVINAYLSTLLSIPRDMFFLPEYTSITTVRVQDDLYALQGLNDYNHLLSTAEAR